MTTTSPPSAAGYRYASGSLADSLIALAGTPDDSSWIGPRLAAVGEGVAEVFRSVGHTSVTAYGDDGLGTVSADSGVAATLDGAQHAEEAGPALDALDVGFPIAVPDLGADPVAAVTWPRFRGTALHHDIGAVLSVPLFAGRGTPVAALNLYAGHADAVAPLTVAVRAVFADPATTQAGTAVGSAVRPPPGWDAFVAGLTGAFTVRAVIQEAIRLVMAEADRTADGAYLLLRVRAAETGVPLIETAAAVLAEADPAGLGMM